MRRRFLSVAALIFAAACGVADSPSITEPTIQRPLVASPVVVQSCPVTFTQLRDQLLALFADGSNDETSALSKLNNIQHQLNIGNIADAQAKAWDLASFIQTKKTKNTFLGDAQEIAAFTNALFCFVGYGPNSFLIFPSDLAQTITTNDGSAGVQVPANNVTVPTLLTINPLTTPPVFTTKLDVYPLFYEFVITNEGGAGSWVNPVVVAVCPGNDVPDDVVENLLLGHQDGSTFEILPEADGFLNCDSDGGSPNIVVAGDSLIAAAVIGSSGVGGSTDDFSPIAPVDGRVVGSSGAGGGADDFRPRRGMTPSMNLVSLPTAVCTTPIQAVIGTEVDPACRPMVTFATPLGTELTVPVDWAVATGGGSIADPATSCSPFGQILTLNTDATTGITTVCWKLGPAVGTNTVTAKGKVGGDAPLGVNFVYTDNGTLEDVTGIIFTATAIKLSTITTITCSPTSVEYNGQPQTPCTAVATDGTGWSTPVTVTYANNTNAGTANASAIFADDATHYGSNDTATFQITQRQVTATAGNGTMQFGGVVPPISCAVAVLVAGDAGAITCTASVTGTPTVPGVATVPTISYNTATAQNNYTVNSVNGFLTVVGYVQVGCFASPIYSVMPDTKSAQKKGSNLPVKCTLKWPNGTAVSNATGSLQIWDLGSSPIGPTPGPTGTPLLISNAFAPASSGNYSHQLNTGVTFFVIGNAYFIRATWSDGSITNGYFRIKQ